MYPQIKPTETFRERHLALLGEAGERRLGRQLRAGAGREAKARSTVAVSSLGLLAAVLAAGLLVVAFSVPALGQQSNDRQQNGSGSQKKDAAVTITSGATTPKASFASGSGANFLGVKVSDHGNLMSFESPQGQEQLFDGQEGYALCNTTASDTATVNGHDTGSVESGSGIPTFSQPTAGKFPLTVTRKTTDGKLKLTQVWNEPDPVEKDVTVAMTVTNLSGNSLTQVVLSRSGDFDVGNSGADQGARTTDSAWQWNDVDSTTDTPPVGLMLGALSLGTAHEALIESRPDWIDGTRQTCFGLGQVSPTPSQDLAMRVLYDLGGLNAGQSKTVKFEYGRI